MFSEEFGKNYLNGGLIEKNCRMEKVHDPREFIRGVQQILINNTIRIGFLFGAGVIFP